MYIFTLCIPKYYYPLRNTSTNSDMYTYIHMYIHRFYSLSSKTFIRSHTDFLHAEYVFQLCCGIHIQLAENLWGRRRRCLWNTYSRRSCRVIYIYRFSACWICISPLFLSNAASALKTTASMRKWGFFTGGYIQRLFTARCAYIHILMCSYLRVVLRVHMYILIYMWWGLLTFGYNQRHFTARSAYVHMLTFIFIIQNFSCVHIFTFILCVHAHHIYVYFMWTHVYADMYVHIYVYFMCTHVYLDMYVMKFFQRKVCLTVFSFEMCMYGYINVFMHMCICVHIYISIYRCICVSTQVHICMNIYM